MRLIGFGVCPCIACLVMCDLGGNIRLRSRGLVHHVDVMSRVRAGIQTWSGVKAFGLPPTKGGHNPIFSPRHKAWQQIGSRFLFFKFLAGKDSRNHVGNEWTHRATKVLASMLVAGAISHRREGRIIEETMKKWEGGPFFVPRVFL